MDGDSDAPPADVRFELLGWPADEPRLRLDYRRFSYAGKFVVGTTGKAVVRATDGATPAESPSDSDDPGPEADVEDEPFARDVLAAVAFNEDRTDDGTLWLRYVTVREDRRGEGLGPRLVAFVTSVACEEGYDRLRIAVNNPFAYEALYKAGFVYVGEQTGLAELVLERDCEQPAQPDPAAYRAGLDVYRERDPGPPESAFLAAREDGDPPARIAGPPDPGR
jgi:GNAT superfamily N-acetyltransferase